MEASRNAVPQKMEETGSYKPVHGLVAYLEAQTAQQQQQGSVLDPGFCTETVLWYYGCAPTSDKSWGCAYRCAQMLLDCSAKQCGDSQFVAPTIRQMQEALAQLGAVAPSGKTIGLDDVGSTKWIEPPLVTSLLRTGFAHCVSVPTVDFEIVREECEAGPAAVMAQYLQIHFSAEGPRTIVMCDDYTFAYTVCGIRKCAAATPAATPEFQVLLFDPHLTAGAPDGGLSLGCFEAGSVALGLLRCSSPCEPEKGPARWVSLSNFFDRSKWMVCFPAMQGGSCTDYLNSVPGVQRFSFQ